MGHVSNRGQENYLWDSPLPTASPHLHALNALGRTAAAFLTCWRLGGQAGRAGHRAKRNLGDKHFNRAW